MFFVSRSLWQCEFYPVRTTKISISTQPNRITADSVSRVKPVISNWRLTHTESAERAEKRMWEFFDWFYFHFLLDCFFVYLLIAFNCWLSLRNHVFFIGERTRLLILGLWHKRRKNRSWRPWVCRKVTGSDVPRDTSTPLVIAVVLWREAGVMNAGLWLVEQIID